MPEERIGTIIVEDDKEASFLLRKYLQEIPGMEILSCHATAEEAYTSILQYLPEILFLDIELPGKSGIELLEEVRKTPYNPCVVFTTAFNHFALKAIKLAAFDYLLKPIDKEELLNTVAKFKMHRHENNFNQKLNLFISHLGAGNRIRLHTQNGLIFLNPDEILYCKAEWNYTIIYLINDRTETVSLNIGKLRKLLPEKPFPRISRSIIINTRFLEKINKRSRKCILADGRQKIELPIPIYNIKRIDEELTSFF